MTIKDIAERCGVSVSTVSRVLNNHPDVSAANRERVMAVMQASHYVPNNSARDLVKPQSDTIGLVVRGAGNPFFTGIIPVIEQAVHEAGYTLVLHQIRPGEDELRAGAELARSKRLRGLILLGGRSDYTKDQTALLGIPFVCCTYTNSFGTLKDTTYSSVTTDDPESAYRAVKHLADAGHRKIAILLSAAEDHSISQLRWLGYRRALEESGLPFDPDLVQETHSFEMPAAYESTLRLLERREDFTALFVISDSMAVAAMRALHDRGKRVPEDCSVVAIDGIDMSAYVVPALTTLVQPQKALGENAVRLLVDILEGSSGNRHLLLDTSLRQGGSVCAIH